MSISLQNLRYLAPHANTDDNATHEYVNIEIVNEYSDLNKLPQQLIFDQVKTANIVDITSDYFLSIVRWNIQSNLPVIIPDMANPAQTKYQITLAYTTQFGTTIFNVLPANPILFKPEDYTQSPVAITPAPRALILDDPFYYLKSVNSFLYLVNTAIQYVINAYGTWAIKPYFEFDAVSGKIVLNMPNSKPTITPPAVPPGFPAVPATTQWYIAMNQPLYNLFNTFTFITAADPILNDPSASLCNYILNTQIQEQNTAPVVGDFTQFVQQTSSVPNWSPVSSIVFSSGTIPVEPQLSGAPDNLNTRNPQSQSSVYQQNSTSKVLTDFVIPFTSGVEATNQQIYYIPTSEFRLIDLLGNNNLNELTIQVFWRDKYGGLHPMTLDAGAAASILILLRKKSFNSQHTN